MNWIANENMERLLKHFDDEQYLDIPAIKVSALRNLMFPEFRQVKDCIIIEKESALELEKEFDKALEMYFDKTEYEACNTETRIDCFFESNISMEQGFELALLTLKAWTFQLKLMQPDSKFCMIVSCDEDHTEIRFHKIHEGEKMWLCDNINDYTEGAIGYFIV